MLIDASESELILLANVLNEAVQDASVPHDRVLPFAEAKRLAQTEFERRYLEVLLRQYQGRVARAAEAAGVDRVYFYRLLRRHAMKPSD